MKWSFQQVWNDSLEQGRPERKLEVRDHIWASEMGGAYIDRYMKMKAIVPTNPPNPRSMRKFEAGNIWEWIVGMVLKRAGILTSQQDWVQFQYDGLLQVTGKLDYLAGGTPNWEKAQVALRDLDLPEFIYRATENIVKHFQEKYPNGLDSIVLEIKSVGSYMFDVYERTGKGNPNHLMQAFHYLKARGLPEAHIVYISKDDGRMLEFVVMNPSDVEDLYKADIAMITNYVKNNIVPPKEREIIFDELTGKFSSNWKVAYSGYLTALYGFENQFAFDSVTKPRVASWNRIFKRCVEGAKMTEANLSIIQEIEREYPNFQQIVATVRKSPAKVEEDTSIGAIG